MSQEQQDIVRIVRDNALELKLIQDLPANSRTAMEPATVADRASTWSPLRSEQKLAALARMISFDTKLKPALVVGDAEKIRTIVDNLVSNAIKYSPRSGVIELVAASSGSDAILDVIDQGPGIAPDHRGRIFDSFYQGPAPIDGRVKGSGLGLAIAREYAMAHGGRIELLDRADGKRGAWFRLTLPLLPGTDPARDAAAKSATLAGIK